MAILGKPQYIGGNPASIELINGPCSSDQVKRAQTLKYEQFISEIED